MNQVLEQIIDNFDQQCELYIRMHQLAEEQLVLLREGIQSAAHDQIHRILIRRQDLLEAVMELSNKNKGLQEQILKEMGLKHFVLSDLKECISADQFQKLQMRVANLGKLLENINDLDKDNQRTMELSTMALSNRPVKLNSNQQAKKAYKKTMENQNKTP